MNSRLVLNYVPDFYHANNAPTQTQIKPPTPEGVTDTVSVPLKYHHAISQQGSFFRTLRSHGVQVDQSEQPQRSAVPSRPTPTGTPSARIDEAEGDVPVETQWEVTSNYSDAEDGDSVWTLKARDQAGLERAQKLIKDAIGQAARMSHVGFLTLADRSMFPRIVGSKGANVARLRNETGADITVSRENNTIVIIGTLPYPSYATFPSNHKISQVLRPTSMPPKMPLLGWHRTRAVLNVATKNDIDVFQTSRSGYHYACYFYNIYTFGT